MFDAVRGYVQMATGLTEITVRKALEVAESLLGPDDDTDGDAAGESRAPSEQVQDLAADIVSRATADKEALVGLIRSEIDKAAGRLGFVREEELAAVRRHVVRLESQVVEVRAELAALGAPEAPSRPSLAKPRSKAAPEGSAAAASHPEVATDSADPGPQDVAKPVKRKVPVGTSNAAAKTDPAQNEQEHT